MYIDSYDFGEIVINGKTYNSDVIIYKNQVDSPWHRREGHNLSLGDLAMVLEKKPEILIIGNGADGVMRVPADVIAAIEAKGIKVMVKRTGDACDAYNDLEGKNVIAALHFTC